MFGSILKAATGFLDRRHERKQAEHQAEVEQIKAGALERANGWKDEFALIVIAAPFIGSFVPGAEPFIRAGFETLKSATPEWYQQLFFGGMAAALGIQGVAKGVKGLLGLRK